jgi:hypothetical protein
MSAVQCDFRFTKTLYLIVCSEYEGCVGFLLEQNVNLLNTLRTGYFNSLNALLPGIYAL